MDMNINQSSPESGSHPMALPVGGHRKILFMSPTQRTHFIAMVGEFVGTTLFLWFGFSGAQVVNSIVPAQNPSDAVRVAQITYLALTFGFSLMVNVWVFYRISGGLFNPAVSLSSLL